VPNAAYRHYGGREDLLQAVRSAALSALAVAIENELALLPPKRKPADAARAALRAVGTAYVRFAVAEPGLFRTAFSVPDATGGEAVPEKAGSSGLNPFQLLGAAIDLWLDAGLLSPARRPGAEFIAWSAVHGLALLIIDGPLRIMRREQIEATTQRLLDMVENGLG
jgi:AcrR family transcriptional regulator